MLVVIYPVGLLRGGFSPSVIRLVSILDGSFALGYAIAYLIAGAVSRGRQTRLQDAAPGDLAFRFASTREFTKAAVGAVAGQSTEPLTGSYFGAPADSSALTIWYGNVPEPVLVLPWSQVMTVQRDMIHAGRNSLATIRDSAGSIRAMQLGRPNVDLPPFDSRLEHDWIVARLNDLRIGKLTRRLI